MSGDDQCQVTLLDCAVFQQKGVSWVTEMDIACHQDKQYVRKSYQSTMDFSKELQVETNVFHDQYSTKEGVAKRSSIPPSFCESESPQTERQRHISSDVAIGGRPVLNQTFGRETPELGQELSGVRAQQRKTPPQKPPRKTVPPGVSILSIETGRQHPPLGQSISISPQPVTPSILDAGSRVSSFAPHSSFRQRGHYRSKSESIKIHHLDLGETSPDLHVPTALKEAMVTSTGAVSPRSQSSVSPKSPRSPRPISPASPNSNSPTRDIHGNVSVLAKSLRLQVPGSIADTDALKKKLSGRDAGPFTRSTTSYETQDDLAAVTRASPEVLAQQTRLFKELNSQLKPETSSSQTSTNNSSAIQQTDNRKVLGNVRKSTFISQDEDGSILEDKSLSSIPRLIKPTDLDLFSPLSPIFKRNLDWDDLCGSATPSDTEKVALVF